jgi:hypothetical protein
MQSLSKTQWFGLSFLALHTLMVALVYQGWHKTHDWQIKLVLEFFDDPVYPFIHRAKEFLTDKYPDFAHEYLHELEFGLCALIGGVAYSVLGLSIGFVMTLVEPRKKTDPDSLDNPT